MKKICLFIYLYFLFISNAHAYLDPGTGSLIIQGIIAGSLSVAIIAKAYWYKLVSFFKKESPEENEDE